ncbi:hypothetical protein QBC40DRAFT_332141, partial [Triangularia verruculosa]
MVDRCIFAFSGIPGLDEAPGGLPPPISSLAIHEKILPRWWECQSCKGITVCSAHQLHLNPLVSTTNPVTGLDNLDQPSPHPGPPSSSFLESSSSDSDDIPNDKTWQPAKRKIPANYRKKQRPQERGAQPNPRSEPIPCHFCEKPMTLSSNLLNRSLIRICTLSGENLIPNRFIPAGIQCCKCAQPHYLSSREKPPHAGQDHPSNITYQGFTAPDPRNPRPPCEHCLCFLAPSIHEKATQEACGGDCWVISAYGERLAKIKDLFTPVSLPWLLRRVIEGDGQERGQRGEGLLHRHARLCEEYITRCSLDLNTEIAQTTRLQIASRERAARSVGRDRLRRAALGEGAASRVGDRAVAAAQRRVDRAEGKVDEAKRRLEQVLEKIEEARVWVSGVVNGGDQPREQGDDSEDSEGGGENHMDHEAEMGDLSGVDGDGDGAGPAEDHDGDTIMNMPEKNANGESENQGPSGSGAGKKRNWDDEPEPEADPSYERYCKIQGIPFHETKPKRR